MTRGEPRPVHITLIATCRVYNSVVVTRRITPGLSPGYETPTDRLVNFLSSRGTWAVSVVRFSRPRSIAPNFGESMGPIYVPDSPVSNRSRQSCAKSCQTQATK